MPPLMPILLPQWIFIIKNAKRKHKMKISDEFSFKIENNPFPKTS
jgi:hypothetical protein